MRANVVVVGAGAAGCVIAARLSQRSDRTVVLLEAGPDDVRRWPDLTATRTSQQALTQYARGFGVGGSAALNGMVANVGEHDDYDEWERVYGCAGWSWRDVRPWFRRVALPLRRPRRRELGPLSAAVLASVSGAERVRLTQAADGRRASVDEVYLKPARERSNLQVRPNALVDRVLFDGRRAVGVLLADGETIEAATVVVCAGALHTPAILLRSGVDRDAVGHGLHDHPSLSVAMRSSNAAEASLAVSVVVWATHVARHDIQLMPFESSQGSSLMAAAMRVHSRGHVRLAASESVTNPLVDFNMLSDERDLDLLRAAARQAAAIATSAEIPLSDEALRAAVGEYVHAAGSCRMGAATDSLAVVDERCRVIAYQSLVVCDASVMPNLPRANPCLPTVMIAERVSAWMDAELRVG
ncbi:MAG: GMC family oxidoreductase [Actinomycetia bacterium]|nr:GMC family oxidoreductase [Actinomycetes bacterium]